MLFQSQDPSEEPQMHLSNESLIVIVIVGILDGAFEAKRVFPVHVPPCQPNPTSNGNRSNFVSPIRDSGYFGYDVHDALRRTEDKIATSPCWQNDIR
jgi:hypothetical protein